LERKASLAFKTVGKYEYVGGDKFIPVHKAAKGGRAVFVSLAL
jgi:hypothetical protein